MMDLSERRRIGSVSARVLFTMLLYAFGAGLVAGVAMMIPVFAEIVPEAVAGGSVEELYDRLIQYVSDNKGYILAVSYAATALMAIVSALLWLPCLKRDGLRLRDLYGPIGAGAGEVALSVPLAFGLNCLAGFIVILTELIFNLAGLSFQTGMDLSTGSVWGNALAYGYAVAIGPVCEEFIFRGMILRSLRKYGDGFALTASAICFSLFHGSLSQIPMAFLLGLLFGYLYLKTNSLTWCTIVHIANNLMAVLLTELIYPILPEVALTAFDLILSVGMAAAAILLWRRMKARRGEIDPSETAREVKIRFYASFPMIVFYILAIYSIISMVTVNV